jgi:uncharacterized protein (TIGR02996 family)
MASHEKGFLDAIFDDPEDNSLRLIYADWLEERGHYRGELIRVHIALLDDSRPDWRQLQRRAIELENRHIDTVCVSTPELRELLHRYPTSITWDRGFFGNVNLAFTSTTEIPDNFSVVGNFYLAGNPLSAPPDSLRVGGNLDLAITTLTALPDNLNVGGYLDLSFTQITALPDDLRVGGDLDLSRTQITERAARNILDMPGLSDRAKVTGLRTAGFENLAVQAERRAHQGQVEGRT